jgi:hypothetical protein
MNGQLIAGSDLHPEVTADCLTGGWIQSLAAHSDSQRLVIGRLVIGRLVIGRLVIGRLDNREA